MKSIVSRLVRLAKNDPTDQLLSQLVVDISFLENLYQGIAKELERFQRQRQSDPKAEGKTIERIYRTQAGLLDTYRKEFESNAEKLFRELKQTKSKQASGLFRPLIDDTQAISRQLDGLTEALHQIQTRRETLLSRATTTDLVRSTEGFYRIVSGQIRTLQHDLSQLQEQTDRTLEQLKREDRARIVFP